MLQQVKQNEARIKYEIFIGKYQWNIHLEDERDACIKIHGHYRFWGTQRRTALQAERSQVRFPTISLEYFNRFNHSGRNLALG